jgi:transcriptional regulator GlxA family with amidase domain
MMWSRQDISEDELARVTARFLQGALTASPDSVPIWLDRVAHTLGAGVQFTTNDLAAQLDLHPAWLARAYRAAVGEGLRETQRRRRVERASTLLRNSDYPAAQIAVEAGFCDQSHMIRGFLTVLGRSPFQVRAERELLRAFAPTQERSSTVPVTNQTAQ